VADIEISRRLEDKINKMFLDPTGHHLIIGMDNGDNYYLHSSSPRPRKLPKWQVRCKPGEWKEIGSVRISRFGSVQ
jgi:hypothetical protein